MERVIATDDYLTEIVLLRKPGYQQAARIVRCQIVIGNRYGHILHLDSEFRRRHITHAARSGFLPRIIVDCARCGCQAYLFDWVRASELTVAQAAERCRILANTHPAWRVAFMTRCHANKAYGAQLEMVDSMLLNTLR